MQGQNSKWCLFAFSLSTANEQKVSNQVLQEIVRFSLEKENNYIFELQELKIFAVYCL